MRDRESWTEQIEDWWTAGKKGSSADSLIIIIIQHTLIFSWVPFDTFMGEWGRWWTLCIAAEQRRNLWQVKELMAAAGDGETSQRKVMRFVYDDEFEVATCSRSALPATSWKVSVLRRSDRRKDLLTHCDAKISHLGHRTRNWLI